MSPFMTMLVTLRTSEPPRAGQNPATVKPPTRCPTNRNRKALITRMPSPIVTKMNGNVNSTSTGLRTALKKLSRTTARTQRPEVAVMNPGHHVGRDDDAEGQDHPPHKELAER